MASPLLDQREGFAECYEDFHTQKFVSEFRVEALVGAVFPRTAWLDAMRLDADPSKPATHVARDELRPTVATNMFRPAVFDEEISKAMQHVAERKRCSETIAIERRVRSAMTVSIRNGSSSCVRF